jgi:hypothetical protein
MGCGSSSSASTSPEAKEASVRYVSKLEGLDPQEKEQIATILERRKSAPKMTALASDDSMAHYKLITASGGKGATKDDDESRPILVRSTSNSNVADGVKPILRPAATVSPTNDIQSTRSEGVEDVESASPNTSSDASRSFARKRAVSFVDAKAAAAASAAAASSPS